MGAPKVNLINFKRRARFIAFCGAISMTLVACGGGSAEPGATTDDAGTQPADNATNTEEGENSGDSGADSAWEDVLAAANEEGELTLYASTSELIMEDVVAAFEDEYPEITVSLLRLSTGPLNARFAEEAQAGAHQTDVLDTSSTELFTEFPDWFKELDEELVPNLSNWPDDATQDLWIESTFGEQSIVYNTDIVTDPPETWEDIFRDEFRGNCILVDPKSSPTYMSWLFLMHETYGDEFLQNLGEMDCTLDTSGVSSSQTVAAGGAAIAIPPVPSHVQDLIDEGAPVAIARAGGNSPTGAHGPAHYYALPAEAPNPNAARVFFNWYLTQEAQEINCAAVYGTPFEAAEGCDEVSQPYQTARFDISDDRIATMLEISGLE